MSGSSHLGRPFLVPVHDSRLPPSKPPVPQEDRSFFRPAPAPSGTIWYQCGTQETLPPAEAAVEQRACPQETPCQEGEVHLQGLVSTPTMPPGCNCPSVWLWPAMRGLKRTRLLQSTNDLPHYTMLSIVYVNIDLDRLIKCGLPATSARDGRANAMDSTHASTAFVTHSTVITLHHLSVMHPSLRRPTKPAIPRPILPVPCC